MDEEADGYGGGYEEYDEAHDASDLAFHQDVKGEEGNDGNKGDRCDEFSEEGEGVGKDEKTAPDPWRAFHPKADKCHDEGKKGESNMGNDPRIHSFFPKNF